MVQCIAQLNHQKLFQFISKDETKHLDQIYFLINHIIRKLDQEVNQAKINLFQAAKTGPMYGCLAGINALLKIINGEKYSSRISIN